MTISEGGPRVTAAVVPIEDTSLAGFYRDMTGTEKRTFWACATGWALDGMDFMIYPLVIGTIIKLWQRRRRHGRARRDGDPARLRYRRLARRLHLRPLRPRPHAADHHSVVLLFSLVCAFVQDFEQLLVARAVLGLGFGGEWAAGAVLMGETIRAQYRGRAVGSVQAGWAVGWGLAVLAQAVLFSLLPAGEAWRWMFGIGVLPALLVLYLRRYVEEPPVAAQARAAQPPPATGRASARSSPARSSGPRSSPRSSRRAARAAITPSPSGSRAFSRPSATSRSSPPPATSRR